MLGTRTNTHNWWKRQYRIPATIGDAHALGPAAFPPSIDKCVLVAHSHAALLDIRLLVARRSEQYDGCMPTPTRSTQPSREEIAKLRLAPLNPDNLGFKITWETVKLALGYGDDAIDAEQHSVGKVTRLWFPFFQYKWIPPVAKWQSAIGNGWSGEWLNVNHRDIVRQLYTTGSDYFDEEDFKSFGFRFLLGGNSPFLVKGAEHVKMRRALIPELSQERVEAYREMSVQVMDRMIDELPINRAITMTPLFTAFAQEMIVRFVFGLDDDDQAEIDQLRDCLRRCMEYSTTRRSTILTVFYLIGVVKKPMERDDEAPRIFRKGRALMDEADALLYGKIAQLREHPDDSIASRMVARSVDDPGFWTDKRIRDMLATLLVAGHETSVSAYQWTLEYLIRNDRPRARLLAEARRGETDSYARACSAEAVRLKPPVWSQILAPKRDVELAGYRVRRGTLIWPLHRAVNVDPELYPDPLEFKPERWLGGEKPDRFGYLSFGAGKHRCPGTMFFGAEASIVFHRLFGRLDIEHLSLFEEFPKTKLAVTYFNRPDKPSTVYVRSRSRAQDVPWFQPAEVVEQALDMPVDELLDGQSDDEETGLDETSDAARCPYAGFSS